MTPTSITATQQTTHIAKESKLRSGDIIAFSINPVATAIEYDSVLPRSALTQTTYSRYLGVVKSSMIIHTPSVVDDYPSGDADKEVEMMKIAYFGTQPPDEAMLGPMEDKGLAPFLPRGSLEFLSIPIFRPLSHMIYHDSLVHHRPPFGLKMVSGGVLPVEMGFVHTTFAFDGRLATLDTGDASVKILEGETLRLAAASAADRTAIGRARTRLQESLRMNTQSVVQSGSSEGIPGEPNLGVPAFTHVAVDVWTDLRDIGPIGEPAAFRAELASVARVIENYHKQKLDSVGRQAHDTRSHPSPRRRAFCKVIMIACALGSVCGYLIKLLKR